MPQAVRLKDIDPLLKQVQWRYSQLQKELNRVGWHQATQVKETQELLEIVADLADLVSQVMSRVRDD